MPQILTENAYSSSDVDSLRNSHPGIKVQDLYVEQLEELFEIKNPNKLDNKDEIQKFIDSRCQPNQKARGTWVYYPWSNQLIHIVNRPDLKKLLVNRNQQLIESSEQDKLQNAEVFIFGLSVGNGIASAMVHSGVAEKLVLADYDLYSTTNINRVRVGLSHVGKSKLEVTCQELYEVNPFLQITALPKGVNEQNLKELIGHAGANTIIFDEMDDFLMKVRIRQAAKKKNIPVVMLTSLGDNLLIDVERYDKETDLQPFNGGLEGIDDKVLDYIDEAMMKRLSVQIVGVENVPTRALESLSQIGSNLVGRPQLYSTVVLDGGFAVYVARQIILQSGLSSGRYRFSYADIFSQHRTDLEANQRRSAALKLLSEES